jgi:MFS family permease
MLAAVPCMVVMTMVVPLPVIPAMLKAFAREPNIGVLAPLAVVIPMLAIAIASIAAGMIGERIGRRRLLEIGTALFALTAALPFWLTSFAWLLASRVVVGVALAAMTVSAVGLTADYYAGAARQRWLAIQGGAGAGSAVLVSVISGALGEAGWRLPFLLLLAAIPLLVALVLLPARGLPTPEQQEIVEEAAAGGVEPVPWQALAAIFALGVGASLVIWPPVYEFGLLLDEKALGSSMLTGVTTAVLAAGAVAGALGFGVLKRLSGPARMAVAFALGGGGTVLVSTASHVGPILAGAVVIGLAQGMTPPILSVWMLDRTPPRLRGRAVGLFQTVFYLAQFAGPLVARWVSLRSASISASLLYYELAAAGVIVMIAALAARGNLARQGAWRASGG